LFLILDQLQTDFSKRLKTVAERSGHRSILLTAREVALCPSLSFFISDEETRFKLKIDDVSFGTSEIEGCYCGINTFEADFWSFFSPDDALYAAKEMQALWLAILASLPCRVINPPALDTLGGAFLSGTELMSLARSVGFRIPMTVIFESGEVTAEVLQKGSATYADLGEEWIADRSLSAEVFSSLAKSENHFRVTEKMMGKSIHVTLVGDKFLVCGRDGFGSITPIGTSIVPPLMTRKLRKLQRQLNLNLAEYHFRIQPDASWIFTGVSRPPSFSVKAFGDTLFEQIVEFATAKGDAHGNFGVRSN
jgi:hypothetical protein